MGDLLMVALFWVWHFFRRRFAGSVLWQKRSRVRTTACMASLVGWKG